MRDTKLNLNNQKFEQSTGDTLNLSGFTEIQGTFRLNDGNQQTGYVMTSDSGGTASWQPNIGASAPDTSIQFNNNGSFSGSSDFIWNQTNKELDVNGTIAISGVTFLKAPTAINNVALGCNANIFNNCLGGVSIGNNSQAFGGWSVTIGNAAKSCSGNNNITIGRASQFSGSTTGNAVIIGNCSRGSGTRQIAIGHGVTCNYTSIAGGDNISIGTYANTNVSLIGTNSVAIGCKACSEGSNSVSIGSCSSALGDNSVVFGTNSCTGLGGDGSLALGNSSFVSGYRAVGVGHTSNVSGSCAVGIGHLSCALISQSIAIGAQSYSSGSGSIGIGRCAKSEGICSISIGGGANAYAGNSIAIGTSTYTNPSAGGSTAIGNGAQSQGSCAVALGHTTLANDDASLAIGWGVQSCGLYAIGLGRQTTVLTANSIAIGNSAYTNGISSIAIGTSACNYEGQHNVIIGTGARVSGGTNTNQNIAIGRNACALCDGQVSIGYNAGCVANPIFSSQRFRSAISIGNGANSHVCTIGQSSIAIGVNAETPSACSIAIGIGACIQGLDAIVMGKFSCTIGGNDSVNIGSGTILESASCSHAFGYASTISASTQSMVFGNWIDNIGGGAKIIMGKGINNGSRLTSDCNNSLNIGWSVNTPTIRFAQNGNSYLCGDSQQLAIGHDSPTAKIDLCATTVCGGFRLRDGNQTNNYVLTSDASGYGTWKSVGSIGGALTGSSNGLTDDGTDVCLGGALTNTVSIDGGGSYGFNLACMTTMCVGNNVANEQVNSYLVSAQDCVRLLTTNVAGGSPYRTELDGNTCIITVGARSGSTNLVRARFDGFNGGILVTDQVGLKGLCYDADYSSNWGDRSIPDKAYVDSIASGLDAKDAVVVATTTSDGNIDLTGGTFVSGSTIDGLVVNDQWRVLIKNQTNAVENGIYIYSAVTSGFTRSEDFDGAPSGEVSNGAFMTVVTGDTLANTQWILTTPDPITVGVTELSFSLLSQNQGISAGDGIAINTVTSTQEISVDIKPDNGLGFDSGQLTVTNINKTSKAVSQTAHGFVVNDVVSFSGGTYIKAIADGTQDSEVFGIVSQVDDANNFTIVFEGFVDTLGGLVASTTYFVSDTIAGQLTASEPTTDGHISKPILATTTSTAGLVLPYRGNFISTGETTINQAANGLSVDATAIKLGGFLCENTTINLGSYSLTFGDAPIEYGSDYSSSFSIYSLVDNNYVTGLTSGLQSQITANDNDISFISGVTDTNTTDITTNAGNITINANDIAYISGVTNTNTTDISTNASNITTNTNDIAFVSANTVNDGTNLGSATQIFAGKSSTNLQFKTISGFTGIQLYDDGSTICISNTAVTNPAGSDTQIQYNDSGSFGASSDFTWNDTTNILNIGGSLAISGQTYLDAGSDISTVSLGVGANADSSCSIAIGNASCVTGSSGVAVGRNTTAAFASVAFGDNSDALGSGSISIGLNSNALSTQSTALGLCTQAEALRSVAIGNCVANTTSASVGFGWGNSEISTPSILFGCASPSYLLGDTDTYPRLGLDTTSANARLHIVATGVTEGFRLEDGNEASGYVLTSDASGNGSWQPVGDSSTLTGNTISGNDSNTVFTINHGCGTRDMIVQVYENQAPYGNVLVAVERPNTACITVTFDTAPAIGEDYRVLMLT